MPPDQSSNGYALLSDAAASPGSAVAANQASRSADSTPLKRPQRRPVKALSLQNGVQPAVLNGQPADGAAQHAEGSAKGNGVSGVISDGHADRSSGRVAHQQSADLPPGSLPAGATDPTHDNMVSVTYMQSCSFSPELRAELHICAATTEHQ